MAYTEQVSIHGISDIGTFTGTKGGAYTETSFGRTTQEGGSITSSVSTVKQRSGQSAAVQDSYISEVDAQLQVSLLNGTLDTIRQLMGLPTTALTGDLADPTTPTTETLTVRGDQLGTEEIGLYMRTMGPMGPRTYYMPRAKIASMPELNHNRTGYLEPNATFDLYEDAAGELYWIEDAAA